MRDVLKSRAGYGKGQTGALNEGIAAIVQQVAGGARIRNPGHIVKGFNKYRAATSKKEALSVFLDAIRNFVDHDGDRKADFVEFLAAVIRDAGEHRITKVLGAFAHMDLLPTFDELSNPDEELPAGDRPVPRVDLPRIDIDLSDFVCFRLPGEMTCIHRRYLEPD